MSAKDITVYVRVDGNNAPNIYYWGSFSGPAWPGETLTQTIEKTPTNGDAARTYYYKTFSNLAEDASISVIFNYNNQQTGDINGITTDRYFYYNGSTGYKDETTDFAELPDATINKLSLAGSFNGWSQEATPFTAVTANQKYTLTLDLSTETGDIEFKLCPNGDWLGWGSVTFTGETGWVADSGNGGNIKLLNSTSGYKTYILTATWAGGTNASEGWTIDIAGGEARESGQMASVNSLTIAGAFNSWNSTANPLTEVTANAKYTYSIDMTDDATSDFEFKLVANGGHWIGWQQIGQENITAPDGWIEFVNVSGAEGNIKLKNSTAGYKTYLLTANWTQNADIEQGWSITIEGVEPRTEPVQHTYQIAGVGELGLTWTPSDNPMTEENGTWTLTKSGLTLFPGNYAYKLVQDGSTWIPDGTGNDHQLTINEIGVYDVVFTMTEPTETGYTAEATKTDVDFTLSVAGSNGAIFGNAWWENAEGDAANAMTLTDGKYVITKTGVELTAGEFQYRVRINGAYTTDQGFAYNANGIFNIEGIGSNKAVTVAQDGKYDITITFDPTAKTVTETLVREAAQVKDYTVTFVNSGNWEGDVSVWAWNNNKNFFETWPGAAATKTAEKAGEWDIWTYTFEQLSEDDLPTYVIFSAGNTQTQDLVFADNGEYWGVDKYGLEGTAFGGFKDDAQYRGIERILTDEGNGVYTYRVKNVALEAVAYPYRVSKNGKWVTNTGIGGVDGNKEFIPEAAGNYNILVTMYNTAEKKDVEVTLTPVGVVTEAKYYIVGEEDLLGVAWAADEANELTFNGDAWTLTKSNLTLTARDYEYKLLKVEGETQTWIPNTTENKILTIEEDGEYNVYFTMSEPTDNGFYALAEKIDEPQPVVTTTVYYVDMQNWGLKAHAWNAEGQVGVSEFFEPVSTKTVNVFGKDFTKYEFSIPADATYLNFGIEGWEHKTSDMPFIAGATYANDGDEPNGIVLFTDDAEQFQPAEDVNVNVKASYARKFDTSKVYTVVLPFAMPADQTAGTFYTLTSVTDGVIHGESVPAPAPYMPYIFEPATEYPFTNINVGQLPKAQVNTINAAGNAKMTFALEQTTLRSDAETTYYGWGTSEGFTKVAVGLAAPFRAWIEMPTVQANANSLVWMNDVVTGIDKVNVEISNGAKVYDLQGRQVTNPHRGIYIVNGKKYVVK